MFSKTYSYGLIGLDAYPVTIEVDVAKGLPAMNIVGLPDSAVKESKERVRSAIRNSGYKLLARRVTVNLSPADTKKEGPSFDLAICLGLLAATEQIDAHCLDQYIILGELSLDGRIQPINGCLSIVLSLPDNHFKGLILPFANASETAVAEQIKIYPARTLSEVIHFLSDPTNVRPYEMSSEGLTPKALDYDVDFKDVQGQGFAKRALEIAAAGGHNVLMIGPPGSGKSMLAKRLPTILPDMILDEALETTKIHSVMGLMKNQQGLMTNRPFRAPHHTTSDVAIVGGGSIPKPGEVTLSHNGVLFLDELPEFNRNVLEALRQPLEDQSVTISRASKSLCFPSKFMLIGAMNPCPCGWFTDPRKECHCHPHQIQKYMSKLSGPLLDRIDIHLEVPALNSCELLTPFVTESSKEIKKRTAEARSIQQDRFKGTTIFANAQMDHQKLKDYCPLTEDTHELLKTAIEELGLSARAYEKILKVSRTIADLGHEKDIGPQHISEAIQYRNLDRGWWG